MPKPLSLSFKKHHILFIAILFFGFSTVGHSGAYSWKDESGRMHFSDTPPANQTKIDVKPLTIIESNPVGNTDQTVRRRKARQADLLRDMQQASKMRKEDKAKRIEQKKQKELRCLRAKNNVKHNARYNRIFHEAPDGERTYLDDEQRKSYNKKLHDHVKKYCP
ncbi:MAG: DUF4124 domain-containing protein [Pseudomonadales bacterium]|nr:DUF4124 domain-containing protein [Pseudomonadales bacterium]